MLTLTFSFTQDKKVWPSTVTSLSGLLKTRQLTSSFAAVITALATRGRQPALNSVMGHEKHPAKDDPRQAAQRVLLLSFS